ncbi:dTDP-glucose 4,6-dehydratase [Gimesia sp.]|uniref:dTDP-glucose 4,6-dehydratase n=1 Tax=Gimesia sp. TaxID=2024833 RepID=UPI000C4D18D3|nr:dTDP-glucose 4,6-dehydratase [Gimesia sp.]MAX36320.1 dTDP-glucose 4,6-dehydratase [Gimesia sp.]HAH49069.1 dTDP-glucose 4,6-dehydratase [Planctomycetaceae bacterium]HBL45130.1 dTDP-glucose 4,6-dehydratase [Planctomycetaceae bacterium]
MKHILITGGCGFIGSNFVRYQLAAYPDISVTNLDKLTYAGNLENLKEFESHSGYTFVKGDITDADFVNSLFNSNDFDAVVNFAAESHVDRSILDSSPFIHTNIVGTQVLLDAARNRNIERYLQVSTDEVYGSLGAEGLFTETTPIAPNSPYSASKASADLLVRSYVKTFDFPAIITRCSNNYGPYQFPEKLIPLFISNAQEDKSLPIYGKGTNVRDWIHVVDHCRGIDAALRKGKPGQVYNFGGNAEMQNIEITKLLLTILNKPESLIKYVTDRPGHDLRYAIDCSKAEAELGWKPETEFDTGLKETVQWYLDHPEWVNRIRSGQYMKYYDQQYGNRLNT